MLKPKDLVKYHAKCPILDSMGLKLNSLYQVEYNEGELVVIHRSQVIPILDKDLEPKDFADNFTKHNCPILPRGV